MQNDTTPPYGVPFYQTANLDMQELAQAATAQRIEAQRAASRARVGQPITVPEDEE